ncbi:unnamed protein product [Urochloa decumbens]|uniref:Uncharacterized protein n=1 Tax=Urochloa decumbens TaxID=240449 RepID=A0ABC9BR21_9POAL
MADGEKIANSPALAVDPIVVMESGAIDRCSDHQDADFAAAAVAVADLNLKARTVSVPFALCASALYAAATSLAVWSVADRPRSVVWAFSATTTAYLILWTTALTRTMRRRRTALISVSYAALAAAAAAHLSSRVGMLLIHLDTAYAAGMFGHALAEHTQLTVGADRSAAAAVPRPSSLSEEELREERDNTTSMSFCAAVVSLVCAACAAFVLCYAKDTYWVIFGVSFLVDLSLYCWTCILTLQILRGVLVEAHHMSTIYLIGPACLCLLDILVSYLFGNAVGMLVYSLGMIAMAGLLGYSLGVYEHYKRLVALEDGSNDGVADEKRKEVEACKPVRVV